MAKRLKDDYDVPLRAVVYAMQCTPQWGRMLCASGEIPARKKKLSPDGNTMLTVSNASKGWWFVSRAWFDNLLKKRP